MAKNIIRLIWNFTGSRTDEIENDHTGYSIKYA